MALRPKFWPGPQSRPQPFGLGLQQMNQQPRRDGPFCLPTTGHHTMLRVNGQVIEDRQLLCERE